jgi:hypothetical protein
MTPTMRPSDRMDQFTVARSPTTLRSNWRGRAVHAGSCSKRSGASERAVRTSRLRFSITAVAPPSIGTGRRSIDGTPPLACA